MSNVVEVSKSLKDCNLAIYTIDPQCDYSHVDDMMPVGTCVMATICDNPKTWMEQNLGDNECPLAMVHCGKLTRLFAGRSYIFRAI